MKRSRASTFFRALTFAYFALSGTPAGAREISNSESAPVGAMVQFMHELNPALSRPLGLQYARALLADAQTSQVDPCLLLAVIGVESHFKASAVSKHGAIGLGQLLPSTAEGLHVNPAAPLANLWGTTRYLRSLLDRFAFVPGRERTAIAAYNAGPNAIARNHGAPTSPANAMYVRRVLMLWQTAKQRLGAVVLPQVFASHRDAAVTSETLADRQTSWWTSEGSSDPVTPAGNVLASRILRL